MNISAFTDILKELIRYPTVVGNEHSFYRILERVLVERGASVTWYEGVLVAHGSRPFSAMYSAHIDRHGLICTGPNEFQYAAFVSGSRSDLLGNSVSEQMMNTVAHRFRSVPVMAYDPWSGAYRGAGTIKDAYICEFRNNLIFCVDGLEYLVAGTPVAFNDRLRIEEGRYLGQLDNVLTAAALVYLFELGFEGSAFFTAQEESGKSWRYLLEWFRRFGRSTNQLIVVDTSPFPDEAAVDQQHVVLRRKDANALFNVSLTEKVESLCGKLNIPFSYKDSYIEEKNRQNAATGNTTSLSLGSTEMGRIISSSNGLVDGTTIQIPTSGYHTMDESASALACESFIKLLMAVAEAD